MPRVLIRYPITIYTVDRAVGRNAPNDRLDVLLVQFLLFFSINGRNYGEIPNWWEELGYGDFSPPPPLTVRPGLRVATPVFRSPFTSKPLSHPKPQGDIVIDGICGDQTIGFIEYFQEQMQLKYPGAELNGQVVPWKIMGALTIGLLNGGLSHLAQPPMLSQFRAFPDELWDSFYL